VDLSARAEREAREITTARRLFTCSSRSVQQRPVATRVAFQPRRLLCAFIVSVTDADGLPVWTTVVGFERFAARLSSLRTARDVRIALGSMTPSLDAAAEGVAVRIRTTAQQLMRVVTSLAVEREDAIVAAVRLRHARVAADLLQPGLFDRRAERRAASQSLVLEEALGRCHDRLDSLGRLAELKSDPPTLAFAAFLR
jgi:hypothetical protein